MAAWLLGTLAPPGVPHTHAAGPGGAAASASAAANPHAPPPGLVCLAPYKDLCGLLATKYNHTANDLGGPVTQVGRVGEEGKAWVRFSVGC